MSLDRDEMRDTIALLLSNNDIADVLEALWWNLDQEAASIKDDQERQPYEIASELLYRAYRTFEE